MNFNLITKKEDKKCKGLYWRGSESLYLSSYESVETRKSLRFLKRMSCSGCEKCDWILDFLKDDLSNNYCNYNIDHVEDGKLYTIKYTIKINTTQGYYDFLYPEVDSVEFIKVEEKK